MHTRRPVLTIDRAGRILPNSAPDGFIFAHDKIGVFAEMGILAPMDGLLADGALDGWLDMTVSAATYKDTLYQLPIYFETLLFMYNRRYMQDEEVPATTEELYAYASENTGRGRYGFVEQHSTAYYSAAWIHGFGAVIKPHSYIEWTFTFEGSDIFVGNVDLSAGLQDYK